MMKVDKNWRLDEIKSKLVKTAQEKKCQKLNWIKFKSTKEVFYCRKIRNWHSDPPITKAVYPGKEVIVSSRISKKRDQSETIDSKSKLSSMIETDLKSLKPDNHKRLPKKKGLVRHHKIVLCVIGRLFWQFVRILRTLQSFCGIFISLINVEVGINVEECKICQITKRGGWDFAKKKSITLINEERRVEKI